MRARDWRPLERNTLRGFFTLELPSGLILNECTYHRSAGGSEWVGLPGRPQIDREGRQRTDPATGKVLYAPMVEIKGTQQKQQFREAALEAVRELLAAQERAAT